MKIVCVCQGGNSRSAAAAYVFKSKGHAAVAIGTDHAHSGLMENLCEWADVVVPMESSIAARIPEQFRPKVKLCDVGEDRYFLGYKQELLSQVEGFYQMELAIKPAPQLIESTQTGVQHETVSLGRLRRV